MLSCLAEVELLGDCTKNLQPKIFKLSHGEIIYALGILSHCGAFSSFVLATHFSIASPNVPTSRTKKRGRNGAPIKAWISTRRLAILALMQPAPARSFRPEW